MRGRVDHLWIAGGAVAAALLITLGWFLLIGPTQDDTAAMREQIDTSAVQLITLQSTLRKLNAEKAKLPQYQAELKKYREALPSDGDVAAFLRQLEAAGNAVGANVSNMSVGSPATVPGKGLTVYALPVTVTADGTAGQLSPFLDQLQQNQPRAVLIETANLTGGADRAATDSMSLTLTMKVFVAPSTTSATTTN